MFSDMLKYFYNFTIFLQLAFKIPTSVPVQPPTTITELIPSVSQAHVPDDQTKQQMIQAMAQHSGMNLEFSQK